MIHLKHFDNSTVVEIQKQTSLYEAAKNIQTSYQPRNSITR
jgi:hypothetical protein